MVNFHNRSIIFKFGEYEGKNKSVIFTTVQPSNNDASDENSEFAGQDALDKALREKEWRSTISKYKFT